MGYRLKLYIGLFDVEPANVKCDLSTYKGAFVNAIAVAASQEDFLIVVSNVLSELNFNVVSRQDIELFESRISKYHIDGGLKNIAEAAERDGQVKFGNFYTYQNDDEVSL